MQMQMQMQMLHVGWAGEKCRKQKHSCVVQFKASIKKEKRESLFVL
jgi:hypothetical protein